MKSYQARPGKLNPGRSLSIVVIFISACLAWQGVALALDSHKSLTQYTLKTWTTDDGLPVNSVLAITQTRDGYIWLGTQDGLVRFDGVRFTVFNQQNTSGIKDEYVVALLEGRDGVLWIGTNNGLTRMKNGDFRTYTTNEGLSSNNIRTLCEGRDGAIWIGTNGGGLNRFTPSGSTSAAGRDGEFTAYSLREGLSSDIVRALFEDGEGNLWVGTQGGGLNELKDGKFLVYTTKEGLPDNTVCSIYKGKKDSLWIGTQGGLVLGKRVVENGHGMEFEFVPCPPKKGFPNDLVSSIFADKQGALWIGRNSGLFRLRDGAFEPFTSKDGLANDLVTSVCEDHEGSLWVGTRGGGVNQFKDGKFLVFTAREGLSNDFTDAVYVDRRNNLWIGTMGGGVNLLQNGMFTTYTVGNGLGSNIVLSICESRDGSVWFGTTSGLSRFGDGRFTSFTTSDGLSGKTVLAIHEDRAGHLWVGTTGGGLNLFKNGKFTAVDGFANQYVSSIYQGREGVLWIGTAGNGLIRYEPEGYDSSGRNSGGAITVYGVKKGLASYTIFSIYEDSVGSLWIGTGRGGLNRFKEGRFVAITARDGLFDDVVDVIIEDRNGDMWMAGNHGISRVKKKEMDDFADGKTTFVSSVSYGVSDGMKSREINGGSPAGCITQDGKLWFATTKGVVAIDPADPKVNQFPPSVFIEQVYINKELVDIKSSSEIQPGSGELEFHFTALSFIAPDKVKFKYLLEGFDKDWVDVGPRRVAYYTNISPGKYRFRVAASNNDGLWNQTGAAFAFHLNPHFYQTIWFYFVCVLVAVGGGFGAYRLRVRRLHLRQQELEALVDERTKNLQDEISERTRMEERLRKAGDELEERVKERTAELAKANEILQMDIVKREEAENAVRKSEVKYRALFEQSKDAVYISAPDGRLLDANNVAMELFGYESKTEALKGDIARDLFANEDERATFVRTLVEQGFVKDYEAEIRRANGEMRHIVVTSTAMCDEQGNITAYQAFMRDVTERKRFEERLRQIQKIESIGTLAGGIAHDFNNILAIILGYLSLLEKMETLEPSRVTQSLEAIKKATQRGTGLVSQLLAFARKTDVSLESVNVNEVCLELEKLLTQTFPKTIIFRLQLDESIPVIVADYTQLHQAVLNLCVNARDAMPGTGTLTISTSVVSSAALQERYPNAHEKKYVCVAVSDTGEGMDEKTLSRIYEPFFTTKALGKGTGLGLAVVYGVVRSLHGFVDVESKVGIGTTFYLYFPVPARIVLGSHPIESGLHDAPGGNEMILVVEDEEMLLDLVRTLLEAKGYATVLAKDGLEALELYKQHRGSISLVLTDLDLPKLGGVEEIAEIKKINPDATIILASGYMDPDLKLDMLRAGVVDFIQKPYEPGEMLRKIREVLDKDVLSPN